MALTEAAEGTVPTDTLAVRLAIVRAQLGGLNITKAAKLCGINPVSWGRYESGVLPRDMAEVCSRIARATGVSYEWLMVGGPLLRSRCVYPWGSAPALLRALPSPDEAIQLSFSTADLSPVG